MRARSAVLLTALVSVVGAGCVTTRPRTEVVIDVGADDALAPRIAAVIARVRGGPDLDHLVAAELEPLESFPNPARITIVPEGDDASRVWDVLVLATSDDGQILGRQRARGGFSAGHTLYASLVFETCCEGVAAGCASDETCRACACVPLVEVDPNADAGAPPLDADRDAPGEDVGPIDAGTDASVSCSTPLDCPAAEPCSVARCERGVCSYASLCGPSETCCQGECAANCACLGMTAGTTCRRAMDDCDAREVCDGVSGVCPPDLVVPAGSSECRASSGECDVAETCDGVSPSCPTDGFVGAGRSCSSGTCNGLGRCDSSCTEGAPCAPDNPCALGQLVCSPTPHCAETGPRPAGTVCRASVGPCDLAETCEGTTCPADTRRDASVVCRPAVGSCDLDDRCDGVGTDCPADVRRMPGSVCRAALGPCDVDELCDGSGASCPPDALAPTTTLCGPTANPCLDPAYCTGTSASCPASPFADGRECGACGGVCSGGDCRLPCHMPYFCCEGTGTCTRYIDDCPM